MGGFDNVGKVFDHKSFEEHLVNVDLSWAKGITLHHTGVPSLAQRPRGYTIQHMRNTADFYKRKGWSAGPHLFIDEDQVFGMCPLGRRGVHARSFNSKYIGIEVLGNYDAEDPESGRGAQCWRNAAMVCALLLQKNPDLLINAHRDDPRTSKTCPGSKVDMTKFRTLVSGLKQSLDKDEVGTDDTDRFDPVFAEIEKRLGFIDYQSKKIRELLDGR